MILNGILCYGAHFKGISVISELAIFCNAKCVSVAEISVEEEALVAPFLCTETRVVLNKNGVTKVSSSPNISATESLSITKYC